jgi:diguanylate cyclase
MRKLTLEKLRHETRFVSLVSTRDVPKRLASAGMILGICWHAGTGQWVLVVGALILLFEVSGQILAARMPEREADIGPGLMLAMWCTNVPSTVAYLLPALLLATQPSVALLLGGMLWMFGVYVHVSNTFVSLPIYNWSQMVPAFLMSFLMFWLGAGTTFAPSGTVDWIITTALTVVYGINTIETLTRQKDTQMALDAARTEANARLRALEHMNQHDALTGLLNRSAFDAALELLLVRRSAALRLAVFVMDLDGFKPINDTYSHKAGDTVLMAVADRLRLVVGDAGIVARFGGDEFALALPLIDSTAVAQQLAESVARMVQLPISYGERILEVGVSIGICLSGVTDDTVSGLCAGADQAMYKAKSETGRRWVFYDPSAIPPRLSLTDRHNLSQAIKSNEIRPFYQPKVDIETGSICGFEALARWVHPDHGLRPPSSFLPQINELGLQGDFLHQMASQILTDVSQMVADGLDPGQVSINIPEMALATHSGSRDLEDLLVRFPQTAGHITFEITEDVFIARSGDMITSSIKQFRRAGVRISLDDFGTGFASFQHLRQLEFDELKIDTSFVQGLGVDPAAEVLVSGFLSIAAGLGVQVIAEGVETPDQLHRLRKLGGKFAQGFLFSSAMSLDEARILMFAEASRGRRFAMLVDHGR